MGINFIFLIIEYLIITSQNPINLRGAVSVSHMELDESALNRFDHLGTIFLIEHFNRVVGGDNDMLMHQGQ